MVEYEGMSDAPRAPSLFQLERERGFEIQDALFGTPILQNNGGRGSVL